VVNRRGASRLGCLIPLLILAIVVYFAIDFGQVYFRAYQFKDAMTSEANFASTLTDDAITRRLAALADSLQLPSGAELITIVRTPRTISISSDYDEIIRLPMKKERVIHFHPVASASLQ
jgi:Flp pilus assembly protein TadG